MPPPPHVELALHLHLVEDGAHHIHRDLTWVRNEGEALGVGVCGCGVGCVGYGVGGGAGVCVWVFDRGWSGCGDGLRERDG